MFQGASVLVGALVHPAVHRSPLEHAEQQDFLATRLVLSAAVLAGAPLFLVFRGAPSLVETAIFGLTLLQLAAATLVARTGRLLPGQVIAVAGFGGTALVLALGPDGGMLVALPWLALSAMEAASARSRALNAGGLALVAVGLALPVLAALVRGQPIDGTVLMAASALAIAVGMVRRLRGSYATARRVAARERARLRAATAASGDMLVGCTADGTADHVSIECETALGLRPGELVGRGLFERVHVGDRPAFLKMIADAAHDGARTQAGFVRLRCADPALAGAADPRFVRMDMRTRRLASSAAAEVVATFRVADPAMPQSGSTATPAPLESSAAKDAFFAEMSHELRTPLNAIIGFSEMLASHTLRPAEQDKQREYARIIHQSGNHLLAVVNSILDMSRIPPGTWDDVSNVARFDHLSRRAADRSPASAPVSDTRTKQIA